MRCGGWGQEVRVGNISNTSKNICNFSHDTVPLSPYQASRVAVICRTVLFCFLYRFLQFNFKKDNRRNNYHWHRRIPHKREFMIDKFAVTTESLSIPSSILYKCCCWPFPGEPSSLGGRLRAVLGGKSKCKKAKQKLMRYKYLDFNHP